MQNVILIHFQGYIFTLTLLTTLVSCASGFLLPNDCPVVPQCDCMGGLLFCEGRNFTKVPTFQNVSYKMSHRWTINLQQNSISSLPDNAFSNLQAYGNNNNVSVLLGNNTLRNENISDTAFRGLESFIVKLSLFSNRLTSVPSFVTRLTHLELLDIQDNPVTYIDPSIFINIRQTLKTLLIGTLDFTYPTSQLLSAVCELSHLEKLDVQIQLSQAQGLNGDNMINCTMNSTTRLKWTSSYYTFPDVLKSFPNLNDIIVYGFGMQYFDDSLVPFGSRITELKLYNTKLQTIPGAINLLSHLDTVVLAHGDIKTVERHSFDNLQHLKAISLYDNPIIYISRFAFRNLVALLSLGLSETKITTIPEAVVTLPNLYSLNLGHNITCTCQPWMKQWSLTVSAKSRFYVYGDCQAYNGTLHDFVFNTLPNCP